MENLAFPWKKVSVDAHIYDANKIEQSILRESVQNG